MRQYQVKNKTMRLITWFLLASLPIIPACRRKEPTPTPVPASIPSDTNQETTAVPPADQNRADEIPTAVDTEDDPRAPRVLPKSIELADWTKIQPIKVLAGDQLKTALKKIAHPANLDSFNILTAAQCVYKAHQVEAEVLFIEASTPMDAFGVFSVMQPQPGQFNPVDGSIMSIITSGNKRIAHAWQGSTYLQVVFSNIEGPQAPKQSDNLVKRIVFNIPAADPPLLLPAILGQKLTDSKMWVVRSLKALAHVDNAVLKSIDAVKMDARLALNGKAWLTIASINLADEERDNVIWLIEYQNKDTASAVYKRYQKVFQSPKSSLDLNTIVDSPKGRFLFGSWTADQESIQMFDDIHHNV